VVDMIFETRCAGCDRPGAPICTTCRFALLAPPPSPAGADGQVIVAVPFTGRARDVVLGLKYRNRRRVGRHLAGLLVNRLVSEGRHRQVDVVTWAPTSERRRRARGYDQAELIARTVARQLGLPCRRLLEREAAGDRPQTGQARPDRLDGIGFRARPGLAGHRVLVVDDVVTTGATLREATAALREQGAAEVVAAAVAATPERRGATVLPIGPSGDRGSAAA
jgi:competence protein ComFC